MDDDRDCEAAIAEALRLTANPPAAWIEAAAQLPVILGDLGALQKLIDAPGFRSRFASDPAAATGEAGLGQSPQLIAALHDLLSGTDP